MLSQFADAIKLIHQYNREFYFVFTGSSSESNFVQSLMNQLNGISTYNEAGKMSLSQLATELAKSSMLITVDSMPLHMAHYLNVPVVALWGPTQPKHFGYDQKENIHSVTLNLSCSPCFIHPASEVAKHCSGRIDCMNGLQPSAIAKKCTDILSILSSQRFVNFPEGIKD
ncbi:MAG: glycosyltransferase family 9 protein [Cyclobacteriaceae bacterium]